MSNILEEVLDNSQLIEIRKNRNELIIKTLPWITAIASFTAAVAIMVGNEILKSLEPSVVTKLPSWQILMLLALIMTTVIFLLYFLLLTHMSKAIALNHIDFDKAKSSLDEHIEKAKEVPKSLTDELNKQISSAKELTSVLKDLSSPHLIHWDRSAELELNAETVYAISPDFNWLKHIEERTKKLRFYSVIYDAIKHPDDKYMYLATDMAAVQKIDSFKRLIVECQNKSNDINEFINKRLREDNLTYEHYVSSINSLSERIIFKNLLSINYYSSKRFTLPIPSDIVLYENTRYKNESQDVKSTYLVISIIPVKDSDKNNNILMQYDAIFKNSEQIDKVKEWFIEVWREIDE